MIRLHNTLGNKIEEFKPIKEGEVKMFVCGPTVYDLSHIGHAKTYTQFDFIVRFLRYSGYEVNYVVNITDIDDKIIKRATEKGVSPEILADEYEKYYKEDMRVLNNTSVNKYARAHDYIPQIVDQVKRLVEKGFAYKISDGYYFDIKKFNDYGKLSGRSLLKPEDSISRIDENLEKKNSGDFCLWKFRREGEPYWPTELGEGRPGWHIEDTAITENEFGPQYDIHGGAVDLIFPHHEAEIAQMEAISEQKPLAKYWLHTGFLNMKSEKMSKSLGNFKTIRSVIAGGISPMALRYFFLGAHYRSTMNFSEEALQGAETAYKKLRDFIWLPIGVNIHGVNVIDNSRISNEYMKLFIEAFENDFNTPEALAVVWKLVKDDTLDLSIKRATLFEFDKILGLRLNEYEKEEDIQSDVQQMLTDRENARNSKDFKKSDELRDQIERRGYKLRDTENGPVLTSK